MVKYSSLQKKDQKIFMISFLGVNQLT